ncbi:MAG: DMT family transporter [Daejeonella sp.]
MKNIKTYLYLFLGMALFGSATPLSKLISQEFPVFIAGMLRVFLAFLVLLPFIKLNNYKKFKGRDLWLLIGIGLIGVLGFTFLMLSGMKLISGVTGSIVMSATPALTAVLSVLIFKDDFGWKKGLAIFLAIAGILVLQLGSENSDQGNNQLIGILLVTGAIICEAAYTLMGKSLTGKYIPEEISAFSAFIAFIGFIPFAFWEYKSGIFNSVTIVSWIYLLIYGAATMGLGSVLWYKGVKQVEGSTAAAFMGVMPVSALLLSYVLLNESFQWIHLLGFLMVFAGVLLIISVHRNMKK